MKFFKKKNKDVGADLPPPPPMPSSFPNGANLDTQVSADNADLGPPPPLAPNLEIPKEQDYTPEPPPMPATNLLETEPEKEADEPEEMEDDAAMSDLEKDLPPIPDISELEKEIPLIDEQDFEETHHSDLPQVHHEDSEIHEHEEPIEQHIIDEGQEEAPSITEEPEVDKSHEGPVFVNINSYKDVLNEISAIKGKIRETDQLTEKLNDIKKSKDKYFDQFRVKLEDLQKKSLIVEKNLFKGGVLE